MTKFEPFGKVKDVEIITRKDDAGTPLKTFAYINVEMSEKNFKKCLATYNNCNWKGNILKVQVAKEDFLSRLQKEKNMETVTEKFERVTDKSTVHDLKSAVPGTPVPEKRNWIIGKYGRALPIIFLRKKDGKKVAKFDPSKTVHCLKRIRSEESQGPSVNKLTWNLDNGSSVTKHNMTHKIGELQNVYEKQGGSKKRSIREVEGINENTKSSQIRTNDCDTKSKVSTLGYNGPVLNCCDTDEDNNNAYINDEPKSPLDKIDGTNDSEINSSTGDDSSVQSEKCLLKSNGGLPREDDSETNVMDSKRDASLINDKQCNNCEKKSWNEWINVSDVAEVTMLNGSLEDYYLSKISDDLTENKNCVNESNFVKYSSFGLSSNISTLPFTSDENSSASEIIFEGLAEVAVDTANICSTDGQSSSRDDENWLQDGSCLSKQKYKESYDRLGLGHSFFTGKTGAVIKESFLSAESEYLLAHTKQDPIQTGSTASAFDSSPKLYKEKDGKTKREVSNNLRLESLKERTQIIQNQKDIIKNALEKVDTDLYRGKNHLIYAESDEEQIQHSSKKITGSKALTWLGMDSSSGDEANEKDDGFRWKEHFDGKSGEKLMKLQQTFGHDQRFKMDARFLESDQKSDSLPKTVVNKESVTYATFDNSEDDEIKHELEEEKQMSLKVLQTLLGNNSVFLGDNDDARCQYRDSLSTHYDPSRDDHAKFEEDIKCDSPKLSEHTVATKKTSKRKEPEVTKTKFYSVSDSLKNLFGKKSEDDKFSFFPDFNENECVTSKSNGENIEEADKITEWKAPIELSQALPYDSSETESEDDEEQNISMEVMPAPTIDHRRYLFYRMENKQIMNALEEESSSFMRKESVENLEKYWVEVRQRMTLDYKKKRKDALRRQKKTTRKKTDS